jgi:glycosyltransferase involved in cell wall biosynthesis
MSWLPLILILPYIILLLKCYRGLIHLEVFKISAEPSTFVSIIVACRNEEKNLPPLLDCLALQNYPVHLFEVIIINDNSTDRTFDIALEFRGIRNIQTINNRGTGKKAALRTGIDSAKGPMIITTDADCIMGTEWIRIIAAFYELHKPELIICPVQIKSVRGFFGNFQALEFLSLQGTTAGFASENEPVMCNGANLAFPLNTYLNHSANLHEELNSGDDVFFMHSLKKDNSSKILWLESPEAIVTTESVSSFRLYIKQRSRWISKSSAYKDKYTIALGIVTFVTIILQISYSIWFIFNPFIAWIFFSILVLKSIPDYLILRNTAKRYGKRNLMRWFIPAQLIYPVYVLIVVFHCISFPSLKET